MSGGDAKLMVRIGQHEEPYPVDQEPEHARRAGCRCRPAPGWCSRRPGEPQKAVTRKIWTTRSGLGQNDTDNPPRATAWR
jgi:hypothetical protein